MKKIIFLFLISYHATAASISGKIEVPAGADLSADDTFVVFSDKCSKKKAATDSVMLREEDRKYHPQVVVGVVGQKLVVHNADNIQHNSFALKAMKFDSGLQKQNTTHSQPLKEAGVTKIFCRIHPTMQASLLTVKNPCFTTVKSGGGDFTLSDIPASATNVFLWNPRLKAPKKVAVDTSKGNQTVSFSVDSAEIQFREKRPEVTAEYQ